MFEYQIILWKINGNRSSKTGSRTRCQLRYVRLALHEAVHVVQKKKKKKGLVWRTIIRHILRRVKGNDDDDDYNPEERYRGDISEMLFYPFAD